MALLVYPSSFKCDCGHESDFSETTVKELKDLSYRSRKAQALSDSGKNEHCIVFRNGTAVTVVCPDLGECAITGDDIAPRRTGTRRRDRQETSAVIKFTPKQGRYLAFIDYYTRLHGIAPAEADMLAYFRTSPPSVHQMVITLERNNLISRRPGSARSIRVLVPSDAIPDLETGDASTRTKRHSHVAKWLKTSGRTLELGYEPKTGTFARAFRGSTLVWSGGNSSDTLDDLLAVLDTSIASVLE